MTSQFADTANGVIKWPNGLNIRNLEFERHRQNARFSKVTAYRQTDRQTLRRINRRDRTHYHAAFTGGNNGKGKVIVKVNLDFCTAPCREHTSNWRSGMARVLKGSQFYLHTPRSSANGMNHTCLFLPSRSWYSFTDPGGMEGWVDLGWLVGYKPKCPAPGIEPGHGRPSQ